MAARAFLLFMALLVGCAPPPRPVPTVQRGAAVAPPLAGSEAERLATIVREVPPRAVQSQLPTREPDAERARADAETTASAADDVVPEAAQTELPPTHDGPRERADATIIEVAIVAASSEASPTGEAVGLAALAATLGQALGEGADAFGIVVEHVPSGERLVHNPRRSFRAASVYKLAVAHEMLRRADEGALSLDDRVLVTAADALEPEPDGGLAPGDAVTVREALGAMMAVSSNAAAHAFLRRIGYAALDGALAEQGLGDTRVGTGADGYARTTPADMAHLLGLIARERTLSEASRGELRRLLALCEEPDGLVEALPDGVEVLSKAGRLEDASNVAGLVTTPAGPVIISIFDEDVDPDEARATIGRVARAVVAHYGGPPAVR